MLNQNVGRCTIREHILDKQGKMKGRRRTQSGTVGSVPLGVTRRRFLGSDENILTLIFFLTKGLVIMTPIGRRGTASFPIYNQLELDNDSSPSGSSLMDDGSDTALRSSRSNRGV